MFKMAPIKINIKSSHTDIAEDKTSPVKEISDKDKPAETKEVEKSKGEVSPVKEDLLSQDAVAKVKSIDTPVPGDNAAPTDISATTTDTSATTTDTSATTTDTSATITDTSADTNMAVNQELYEYEGEDVYYTNPQNKVRYKWDKESGSWLDPQSEAKLPPSATSDQYQFDGTTYFFTDEKGVKQKWNLQSEAWEPAEESEESEEDDNTTEAERKARQYRKRKAAPGWQAEQRQKNVVKDPVTGKTTYKDENDGLVYEWDETKKAWFPSLGEDFMAMYQLNYGFTNDLESKPTVPDPEEEKPDPAQIKEQKKKAPKKEQEPPKWFDEDENKTTKVYVSGLPSSITEESFVELMSKCGMVEHDIRNKKPKVKLYKDAEGVYKGDGLCSYIKPESVQLALTILDGSDYEGRTLTVQRAKFEMKGGEYDPKLKPKKLRKKELEKLKRQREKLFAWVPDKLRGERFKNEKVIVIKNLFDPAEFDVDPGLILDYTSRIRAQCSKFGTCTKVALYDKHEEGVCQIFFQEAEEADMAKDLLHGRLFGKRIMTVETWDGKTKYKKEETLEEEQARLAKWDKFLAGEEDEEEKKGAAEVTKPGSQADPPVVSAAGESSEESPMEVGGEEKLGPDTNPTENGGDT